MLFTYNSWHEIVDTGFSICNALCQILRSHGAWSDFPLSIQYILLLIGGDVWRSIC